MGVSIIELDRTLQQIIDLTAIRKSEWDAVVLISRSPKKNRNIHEFGALCYHHTQFTEEELQQLLNLFFSELPTNSFNVAGYKYTYEETMLVSLTYMANANSYISMASDFGGDFTTYSRMVNWFAKFLFHKYYHRLCGVSLRYFFPAGTDNVTSLRAAIFNYVKFNGRDTAIPELRNIEFKNFRPFGWMDCMQLMMSTPGTGTIDEDDNRRENRWEIQRAFFSNYGHCWGMKAQGILLPNGMLASLYLTSIAHNDKGVVNISGIEEELEGIMQHHPLPNNNLPCLYCDRIYNASATICTSNGNAEDVFHKRMNSSRIDIEHEFGLLSTLSRRLTTKHAWKLMTKGFKPREHLFSIFFMLNIYSCLRGNKTATKYNFQRTDIEDYLDVTMDDAYDGVDKDELMYNRLRTQY